MKALKFNLSGETAFFKDNSINTVYLTYENIHRIALLGIFGAILGYSGYNKQIFSLAGEKKKKLEDIKTFPEFYEKLKDLKIAIVSNGNYGTFSKKIQSFNNGVGYASKEEGGNLIVKQFWLEKPSWDIYILIDSILSEELSSKILDRKSVYMPYLGSNDHFADIKKVELIEVEKISENEDLLINSMLNLNVENNISLESCDKNFNFVNNAFKYSEYLPSALTLETNQYIKNKMLITNMYVSNIDSPIYYDRTNNKNVIFY
ncbi:MAG: type I-B CRISPR-associated protein Cas5 [Fusobacterium sp.]|nr:type I-B CRISPR-associated protein Cas5 [Fusobacterium sp.]